MDEFAILVLEAQHRWTPELQRQFAGEGVRVRGIRKATDAQLTGPEVIVLDFDTAPQESLALIARAGGSTAERPLIVVGTDQRPEVEWILLDLGAAVYLPGPVSGEDLAAVCRKQWTRTAAGGRRKPRPRRTAAQPASDQESETYDRD